MEDLEHDLTLMEEERNEARAALAAATCNNEGLRDTRSKKRRRVEESNEACALSTRRRTGTSQQASTLTVEPPVAGQIVQPLPVAALLTAGGNALFLRSQSLLQRGPTGTPMTRATQILGENSECPVHPNGRYHQC